MHTHTHTDQLMLFKVIRILQNPTWDLNQKTVDLCDYYQSLDLLTNDQSKFKRNDVYSISYPLQKRFSDDPRWSETGDRYVIKLFREYLFHQINEVGVPVIDMAHVISCLNKVYIYHTVLFINSLHFIQLDAGVDEKILLTSRDDETSIIVSYKEIKDCINSAFNDLYSSFHVNNNKTK